jgi:hypothetical protein
MLRARLHADRLAPVIADKSMSSVSDGDFPLLMKFQKLRLIAMASVRRLRLFVPVMPHCRLRREWNELKQILCYSNLHSGLLCYSTKSPLSECFASCEKLQSPAG